MIDINIYECMIMAYSYIEIILYYIYKICIFFEICIAPSLEKEKYAVRNSYFYIKNIFFKYNYIIYIYDI